VTADEERELLAAAAARIDEDMREQFAELIDLIGAGMPVRDAVAEVMGTIEADLAATLATALTAVTGEAVTVSEVLQMNVGPMRLSPRLYQEADQVAATVSGIVDRHVKGFTDARSLALELFEGYAFRPPEAEPLQFKATNPQLPQYLREVLRTEPGVERALASHFAQLQVNGLTTPGLRAAYTSLLDAITEAADGIGAKGLEKRIEIAWFERMRYFSQRIVQTEIHRAYAKREAMALMADAAVQYVQIRRAPGVQLPCICDLFAGRDVWGLGKGVYPKAKAPLPPFHPYCRCVTAPRLDLTGKTPADQPDDSADVSFLQRLNPSAAARVVGSRDKLARVLAGEQTVAVVNATRDARYAIKTLAEAQ
jgi:hypothetical protein